MTREDSGANGLPRPSECQQEEGIERPTASAALDLICVKLQGPNFSAYEVMKLVTYVMFTLATRMLRLRFTVEDDFIRHRLYTCVNLLRAGERFILDTEKLRKRADTIYWGGQAIEHVINTMTEWFLEAMTQAGLEKSVRDLVIRYYRNLSQAHEPQLRRETEK